MQTLFSDLVGSNLAHVPALVSAELVALSPDLGEADAPHDMTAQASEAAGSSHWGSYCCFSSQHACA